MKTFINLIFLLLLPGFLVAQQAVTMKKCWQKAYDNMPAIKQKAILIKLDSLEQVILRNNYLPEINVNAQVGWQSDVVGVDIDLPMINIDKPSKDQYKAFLEINQLIWDGGRTKAMRKKSNIEISLLQAQTEEAFYEVKKHVSSLYFGLILSQKQIRLTKKLIATLKEKMEEINSAVHQGVVREANYNVLKVEKLSVEQQLTEQQKQTSSIISMLNVITGMNIRINDSLIIPEPKIPENCQRQKLTVFELQKKSFDAGNLLLKKNRMPVFNAFAQAGYGKPGLNMLKTEADSWFMSGARVAWNIFDRNTNKYQRKKLVYSQQMIDYQKEQFLQQVDIMSQQYINDIEKYEILVMRDKEIIDLRQKITEDYNSRLKQGTVTSSAYVDELFKESAACITKEIHAIKLIQSQINLQIIMEK